MQLAPFKLERYFARYEFSAPHLLCCSDCESLTLQDLLKLDPSAEEGLKKLWLGYTESSGNPELRERISELYTAVKREHILVHAGAEEGVFNFMNVALQPGDHVIVHYPCYQSLAEIARSIGCEVSLWKADEERGWSLDIDALEAELRPDTKAVIINCPHNPTGYVMDEKNLRALAALSEKHGFLIFSDEVYRLLERDGCVPLPPICDLTKNGVSLGVMSKSFGLAGLRIGWIATHNKALYEKMASFKDYLTICSSAPSEFLATVALRNKDAIVARNREIISKNMELLDRFFAQYASLFSWYRPFAGPIAFPRYKGEEDLARFCHRLVEEAGVLLLPGATYGDEFNRNFRLGFGRKNLAQCLEKFEQWLRKG